MFEMVVILVLIPLLIFHVIYTYHHLIKLYGELKDQDKQVKQIWFLLENRINEIDPEVIEMKKQTSKGMER